jgi:SAM-dependent methyltransferase
LSISARRPKAKGHDLSLGSQPPETRHYVGDELTLFARAQVWKGYVARQVAPFFGPEVLEVGAGLGATTEALVPTARSAGLRRWLCLEPDGDLCAEVRRRIDGGRLPAECATSEQTLPELADEPTFDTILYMDVLEHIEDDFGEVAAAVSRLKPGGHLVVLAPAHGALFTPFDRAIGHFRRYDRRRMLALEDSVKPKVRRARLRYLDCVGLLASAGNRFVLSSAMPTTRQLWLWDRFMVRGSKCFDPLLGYRLGKSILAVWRREEAGSLD